MNRGLQIQQEDTRKPAFRWLGRVAKPNTESSVTVVVPPPGKSVSNKRAFGTDITNIDMNRGNLDSKIQKKAKLGESGGDILKNCKVAVQSRLGQGKNNGFVYGPFHPAGARKQELDGGNKPGQRKRAEDWESLSVSFRPQYQNQGLFTLILFCSLDKLDFPFLLLKDRILFPSSSFCLIYKYECSNDVNWCF